MSRTKGAVSQEILLGLMKTNGLRLMKTNGFGISGQSPRFWREVYSRLFGERAAQLNPRKIKDAFYYLKKKRLIAGEVKNGQIQIHLSPEGKREARLGQINQLKITRPRQWDKKWRLLILDLSPEQAFKREVLRRKIKQLGFYPLARQAWVFPFACEKEIKLLRQFFQLKIKDLRLAELTKLEEDWFLREAFSV